MTERLLNEIIKRLDKIDEQQLEQFKKIVKTEQHLSDINGSIVRHDRQLTIDCPVKHTNIDDKINSIRVWIAAIGGALIIINILAPYVIEHLFS